MSQNVDSRQFALAAAELAANTRCEEVVVLDLRGRSPVTEFFVIATGTSPRQMRTVADEVADLGKKIGFAPWKMEGYESARWIVMDCVSVVIHVLDFESRDYYDLELLWGEESAQVDWRKALGLPPAPPGASRAAERAGRALAGNEGGGRLRRGLLEQAPDDEEGDDLVEVDAAGGDADLDEDAEADAPVITEVAEEEEEGVELVEIDPPAGRAGGGKTLFPVQVPQEEELESAVHVTRDTEEEDEEEIEMEVQAIEKAPPKARKKPPAKPKPAARKKARKPAPKRTVKKAAPKPAKKKR